MSNPWRRTDVPSLPWQTGDFRNPVTNRPRIVAEFERLVREGAHPHYAWLAAQESCEVDDVLVVGEAG